MTYISDIIGQDYLNWNNQYILISSHTGSGKTTFILNQLLPHAIKQNKYILYLCNNKVLNN